MAENQPFDKRPRLSIVSTDDRDNALKYLTHIKGHVMVRRRGAAPFVVSECEWTTTPLAKGPSA